ncbi:MAG TPA: hypothetical protein VFE33_18785 [Thermoanaerobaculia bacterium]|nr:hypothetical protein [Thermoanaerobaculia bacterium]
MRKWIVPFLALLLVALMLSLPRPAHAVACTLDRVPAATLLLPYFEVDLGRPNGRTTLMAVVNASAQPQLAHVVLWTDLGVPTLTLDLYLTGFDTQSLNLRDLFAGSLPQTADAARDPNDRTSPRGRLSQDGSFPGCFGLPPAPLSAVFREHLRTAHTGLGSPLYNGFCAGLAYADNVARGYVTVDVARRCSYLFPGAPGYFGPDGVVGMDNVLFGDFVYLDSENNLSDGNSLVAIEAAPSRFGPGAPTFYRRYVENSGADGREPLPTRWAVRFLTGGAFSGGTDAIAWREVGGQAQPFSCGQYPGWFPTAQRQLVVFDEQEHPVLPFSCPFECPPQPIFAPFPGAANRTRVGGAALPVPYYFGWLFLDLNPAGPGDSFAQSWMGTVHSARGRFSVGVGATALDSGCDPGTIAVGY